MDYQAWVIENIETLSYEYDFYVLERKESNKTVQSFKEYCTTAFTTTKEMSLA